MGNSWGEEMKQFLETRNALFINPNLVDATKWWIEQGFPRPARFDVPLATVHKARLQWLDATDVMIIESTRWLLDNGYETTMHGAPPLTPERRDADRVSLGKPPLGKVT
jgi:hypothetical protein